MIQGSILQEDIIFSVDAHNNRVKICEKKLIELQGEIYEFTIIVTD